MENYIGTILLSFSGHSTRFREENVDSTINEIVATLESNFGPLKRFFSGFISPTSQEWGRIVLLAGDKGLTITVRIFPKRSMVTCNLDYDAKELGRPLLSFNAVATLEESLTKKFSGVRTSETIPEIKRGMSFNIYFTTSDRRLLQYDIQEMIFDEVSPFQHIQIARTINYGNMLILDGFVNLAEADILYTETLMSRGSVDYSGKDVLILGGGDGALLFELRKENARSITMIEIDHLVMEACGKYMRSVCGDTLDEFKKENYEIIVGDCIPFMEKCQVDGKKYDFVFGDLTDVPLTTSSQTQYHDFFKTALKLSFSILNENGSFFTHANGATVQDDIKIFEELIKSSVECPVNILQSSEFIPSFMEKWIFFQVTKIPNEM